MKKTILFTLVAFMLFSSNAQEKGKVRFGLDLGFPFSSGGGIFLGALEAKYNISNNSNVGLRVEIAEYNARGSLDQIDNYNYLATYDYYFHEQGSSFAAFLGAGLGLYRMVGFQEATFFFALSGLEEVTTYSEFGFMIRGGIEVGKFRLNLAYNIIPKTDFEGAEIQNSYVGIGIGFYVGGGKWKSSKNP